MKNIRIIRGWYTRHEAQIEPRQRARFRNLITGPVLEVVIRHDRRGMLVLILRQTVQRAFCIVRDASNRKRIHILEVPPETHSCTAGLAWKAQMTVSEYEKLKIEA